jgi:integrase
MSYLSKKEVLNGIKSRIVVKHNGEQYTIFEAYFGTDPYSKKPIRKASVNKPSLIKSVDEFYRKLSTGGDTAVLLTAFQSMDALNAINLLSKHSLDISLTECVRRVIDGINKDIICTTKLITAYENYLVAQRSKSYEHQKAIKSRVGKWIELFGGERLLSDVTPQEVSKDLESRVYDDKKADTKTTYNNHLGYIRSFLNWCVAPEQGYIKENPIASMKMKVKEWKDPEYLKAKDAKALFTVLEKHKYDAPADLAYAILSFFCGMRQDEIKRVRLGDDAVRISLEHRNIRVVKCKGASKGVKPRSFTIPNTALAWMQSFDFMSAVKIKNEKFRNHLKKRAAEAGIELPKNVGRHTFITMHAAAYHDQNLLTSIAGNTDDVRRDHYDGLTFENEGKAYFEILPTM